METIAYLHLETIYANPEPEPCQLRWFEQANWKPPSSAWISLVSVIVALSIMSTTAQAEAAVFRRGSRGPQVATLQNDLKVTGYFPNRVRSTGFYGSITETSVRRYQRARALRADGIAGPSTLAVLNCRDFGSCSRTSTSTSTSSAARLRRGSRGTAVTQLQNNLKTAGFFPQNVRSTGFYGPVTENAVRQFQQTRGLRADGVAGEQTLLALAGNTGSETIPSTVTQLRSGSSGPAVTQLQNSLTTAGVYSGPVTGYYGRLTQTAVGDFQRTRGLPVTGVADANTLSLLRGTSGIITPTPITPTPIAATQLRRGNSGQNVTQLQNRMRDLGIYSGPVTGFYGELTETAIRNFQRSRELPVTGIADANTLAALQNLPAVNPTPTTSGTGSIAAIELRRGSSGAAVTQLQTRMRALGVYAGPVTGNYGRLTETAVRNFQQSRRLPITGIADTNTLAALQGNTIASGSSPSAIIPLQLGDNNSRVISLQRRLVALDYYRGPTNGLFDINTEAALKKYQQDRGLTANGIADARTFASLAPQR
ncbi:MAG: hypothetical protein F6J89_11720 [Symploca sp. SIO1C4]|uniref:Peptidoglycan binding-like domain-containing protein n=1 Tax=Symploca sp. SIO1C4 TaxID=2607765 RepID=A0A6B3NCE1_9CYAN|nr:hypothetical protein [Symploca sp. SIO1C4]